MNESIENLSLWQNYSTSFSNLQQQSTSSSDFSGNLSSSHNFSILQSHNLSCEPASKLSPQAKHLSQTLYDNLSGIKNINSLSKCQDVEVLPSISSSLPFKVSGQSDIEQPSEKRFENFHEPNSIFVPSNNNSRLNIQNDITAKNETYANYERLMKDITFDQFHFPFLLKDCPQHGDLTPHEVNFEIGQLYLLQRKWKKMDSDRELEHNETIKRIQRNVSTDAEGNDQYISQKMPDEDGDSSETRYNSSAFSSCDSESISSLSSLEEHLEEGLIRWKPMSRKPENICPDVDAYIGGEKVSRMSEWKRKELMSIWKEEDRELAASDAVNSALLSQNIQSMRIDDDKAKEERSNNSKDVKGEGKKDESKEVEDIQRSGEKEPKGCEGKLLQTARICSDATIEEKRRKVVKKQIKEAKMFWKVFGVWLNKSWTVREWEREMWAAAEARTKGKHLEGGKAGDEESAKRRTLEEMKEELKKEQQMLKEVQNVAGRAEEARWREERVLHLQEKIARKDEKNSNRLRWKEMTSLERFREKKREEKIWRERETNLPKKASNEQEKSDMFGKTPVIIEKTKKFEKFMRSELLTQNGKLSEVECVLSSATNELYSNMNCASLPSTDFYMQSSNSIASSPSRLQIKLQPTAYQESSSNLLSSSSLLNHSSRSSPHFVPQTTNRNAFTSFHNPTGYQNKFRIFSPVNSSSHLSSPSSVSASSASSDQLLFHSPQSAVGSSTSLNVPLQSLHLDVQSILRDTILDPFEVLPRFIDKTVPSRKIKRRRQQNRDVSDILQSVWEPFEESRMLPHLTVPFKLFRRLGKPVEPKRNHSSINISSYISSSTYSCRSYD